MMKNLINKINSLLCFLIVVSIGGCKKFVDVVPPTTSITGATVYNSDQTAISVLNGIYTSMSSGSFATGSGSISYLSGLSADEFTLWPGTTNGVLINHYRNNLSSTTNGFEFWTNLYSYVFTCNSAIEGISNSTSLTPSVKNQLLGEAKFLRALMFFYLTNLYGEVPLVITTDYKVNTNLPRSSVSVVYQQMISDLLDAESLLGSNYLNSDLSTISAERVRPSKWAASALLSRVYLYNKDWQNAELKASLVLNNSSQFQLSNLDNSFLKASMGNKEAIWQLQTVTTSPSNTWDAVQFIIPPSGPGTTVVYLSNNLLNAFETGDNRKNRWVDSVVVGGIAYYYPKKYKIITPNVSPTEFLVVLRLSELYLIRAEARAQLNNVSGSQADINAVRNRASLSNTSAADKSSLLTAIQKERQVEFFSEWGHRWFDLKRTETIDAVMNVITPIKATGSPWQSFQKLYPLPLGDIQKSPSLTQNQGYQ